MCHTLSHLSTYLFLVLFFVGIQTKSHADLLHRFSFSNSGVDSVTREFATLNNGASLSGGQVHLDGQNDYVSMPIGETISRLRSCTFEVWVTWPEYRAPWSRIFDCGQDSFKYLFLTPRNDRREVGGPQNLYTPRFAISLNRGPAEEQTTSTVDMKLNQETHFVVTIDDERGEARLYEDGVLVGTDPNITLRPSDLGNTPNNWLGRSQFSHDPYFKGSISEFRVYDTVLSHNKVIMNFENGPDVSNPSLNDCNENQIPDAEEIEQELVPDCNLNGIPDSCDIRRSLSSDIDGNEIPDECQEPEVAFEFLPQKGDSVSLMLRTTLPSKGGEIGFVYDSNKMVLSSIHPGPVFPSSSTGLFPQIDVQSSCIDLDSSIKGAVVGWISTNGEALPPGDYELLQFNFVPSTHDKGGQCSPLTFVNCLGAKEAPFVNKLLLDTNQIAIVKTIDGEVCATGNTFLRGDADGSGIFDITDPLFTLGCLFVGSACPECPDAADSNDDGVVDITDAIYLLGWRFLGTPPPKIPFNECGLDTTEDSLGDCLFPFCED